MESEEQALKWSATFDVDSNALPPAQALPGDKIILPQSALEQLLNVAASRSMSDTNSLYVGNGDRAESQKLPQPLMFRIVNSATGAQVYAGIREFSAPDNTIAMSPYLSASLGIDSTKSDTPIQVVVHAALLPKGTFVRFRPLESGYNPDDWKPLLERQLRYNFTCLTKDTSFVVNGAQGERFQLLIDKVEPDGGGVCVIDTDIEVDIEPLNEEQARETLEKISAKQSPSNDLTSSQGGEIDIWKSVQGRVRCGDYVDYYLPSWDRARTLRIQLLQDNEDGLVDLFATPKSTRQRSLPRTTEHVWGSYELSAEGTKELCIPPDSADLATAEGIMISIHGTNYGEGGDLLNFTLRAQTWDHDLMDIPQGTHTGKLDTASHGPDEAQCNNCLQWVPKSSMLLHENFCRRNNITCPQCGLVFQKSSTEWQSHWHCEFDTAHGNSDVSRTKHDDVFHSDRQCHDCLFVTNSIPDLARHRTTICPGKLILCQFCHLEVPQEGDPFNISPEVALSGMSAHELADGARTTECHLCDKIVRLRDMEMHLKHHELDKVGKSKPPICRNINCGRTKFGVGPKGQIKQVPGDGKDQLGLCSLCFGPLYVSMHDPEGKALKRRIERRYLAQLMTGCVKPHCNNEWCKTGRANRGLEPKGSSAQAALPAVKPLLTASSNTDEPFYFCVDEGSQTGRKLAEMLAAEKGWELEWCIAAAECQKSDLNKMTEWLQAWAPRR